MRTASFSKEVGAGVHVARPLDEEGAGGEGADLFGDRVGRADVADAEVSFDGVRVPGETGFDFGQDVGFRAAVFREVQRRRHGNGVSFLGSVKLSGHWSLPFSQPVRRPKAATGSATLTVRQSVTRGGTAQVGGCLDIDGSGEAGAAGGEVAAAGAGGRGADPEGVEFAIAQVEAELDRTAGD